MIKHGESCIDKSCACGVDVDLVPLEVYWQSMVFELGTCF